ncbi:MAG: hypothetical protein JNK82_00860 [Myxococcaceae bacterium]|nr:hypothetical protein [Myxococcaceae bacterium]
MSAELHAQLELFSAAGPALAALPYPPREERLVLADALARRISRHAGVPVRLAVTDNRSTMVSYQRQDRVLALRLHHMFLDAPDHVVEALAHYAGKGNRAAGRVIDDYIDERDGRIRRARRQGEQLVVRGRCFDLAAIFDALNREHFQGSIRARIGWARAPKGRRRKTIRLGVYEHQTREIRIHPSLDGPDVPHFFVKYIVFHEMLHQLFPNAHHPKAFRDREKTFPRYGDAIAWEKQHLKRLLRR